MLDESRLLRLINAYFDQELDAEEKRELESMLLGSAKAREIFIDQSQWHGLHREVALRELAEGMLEKLPENGGEKVLFPFKKPLWTSLGIAACLMLALWLKPVHNHKSQSIAKTGAAHPTREDVALLAQAVDVEWEDGGNSYGVGSALPKGPLKIRKGTLRLDFYSGARVFLEGPATLDLMSQDLARLENGRLTANVPPPAQGFTILNANLRVVDRGTEFGMSVKGTDNCEVHVFKGEVVLQSDVPANKDRSLLQGDGVSIRDGKWATISADRNSFADPATVLRAAARETDARWESWRTSSRAFSETPGMLVHFDFEDMEPSSSLVTNRAKGASPSSNGTVIGCDHTVGRWAKKSALGFAKTSDRVRFRAEGTTPSLTMIAWVRVDSLPLNHNALLSMSPGRIGEIHWKLDQSGRLLLGIRATNEPTIKAWERLVSPPIITEQNSGSWIRLATVIDGEKGVMTHYVDGREVASAPMSHQVMIQLGMANIGNFDSGLPSEKDQSPVRNFNGRFDEFALISRALSKEELFRDTETISPR